MVRFGEFCRVWAQKVWGASFQYARDTEDVEMLEDVVWQSSARGMISMHATFIPTL